ncbi:MAG: DUF3108 domain-containing protein [Opitutaceae bacterium]
MQCVFRYFQLVVVCLLLPFSTTFADKPPQFQPGDRFVYDLYWSSIKVGVAELSFTLSTEANPPAGKLLATFTVNTSGIADKLFKVRDKIESWIDPVTGQPVFYKKKQREGKTKRDVEVDFDWQNMKATCTKNDRVYEPIELVADTFDPLSLLTRITQNDYSENKQTKQATTDGKKLIYIQTSLKDTKKLKVKAGKFEAHRVEVATKELEGVFEKSDDASIEIWLSQDTPAIPLKMKSKVAVGSFYGELRSGVYRGKAFGKAAK